MKGKERAEKKKIKEEKRDKVKEKKEKKEKRKEKEVRIKMLCEIANGFYFFMCLYLSYNKMI